MPPLAVTKMHGTLNDFIVIDCRREPLPAKAAFARRWCHRREGIGADGVLLIEPSQLAHARMRVINSDGSEAEMCGNGVRCVTRFLFDLGEGTSLQIETIAGAINTNVVSTDPFLVRVNMGTPAFASRALPFDDADFISMGNPHAVVFVPSAETADLAAFGARAPEINVHVAAANGSGITVRHHERGVGATQACGTGAVAAAAASIRRGIAASPVAVHVPGGELTVEWDGRGDAYLTGPAVRVFDATIHS